MGWFGGWGGGAKETEVEPSREERRPAGGGEPLGDMKGDGATQGGEEKALQLRPIAGGDGAGDFGQLKQKALHPGMRPIGAKLPNVPISETVDLETPGEGLLWQPTSMSPLRCGEAAGVAADECEATVRFCLMKMAEYQETPWKYPMAVMLQKKSGCSKAENLRSFRLSALRVRGLSSLSGRGGGSIRNCDGFEVLRLRGQQSLSSGFRLFLVFEAVQPRLC